MSKGQSGIFIFYFLAILIQIWMKDYNHFRYAWTRSQMVTFKAKMKFSVWNLSLSLGCKIHVHYLSLAHGR